MPFHDDMRREKIDEMKIVRRRVDRAVFAPPNIAMGSIWIAFVLVAGFGVSFAFDFFERFMPGWFEVRFDVFNDLVGGWFDGF